LGKKGGIIGNMGEVEAFAPGEVSDFSAKYLAAKQNSETHKSLLI
jgi:hypothetical protein